jgi:hypothetical protein
LIIIKITKKKDIHKNHESNRNNEVEELFFIKIYEGSYPYKLLSIYIPFDLMMIKSLLISTMIPYYVEFEHIMGLVPLFYCINYNNANLYILEEDYNDAILVIKNHLKNKALDKYDAIPFPKNHMGFYINYKQNDIINQEKNDTRNIDENMQSIEKRILKLSENKNLFTLMEIIVGTSVEIENIISVLKKLHSMGLVKQVKLKNGKKYIDFHNIRDLKDNEQENIDEKIKSIEKKILKLAENKKLLTLPEIIVGINTEIEDIIMVLKKLYANGLVKQIKMANGRKVYDFSLIRKKS